MTRCATIDGATFAGLGFAIRSNVPLLRTLIDVRTTDELVVLARTFGLQHLR